MTAVDRVGPRGRRQRGQATVEVALVLPLVAALALALVAVAITAARQVAVVDAARAAARVASVSATADDASVRAAALAAAPGLDPDQLTVDQRHADGIVVAEVRYRSRLSLPLVAHLLPVLDLTAAEQALDETDRPP